LQGRTGPHFQDFNNDLIEDMLARYPNLVRRAVSLRCYCCGHMLWLCARAGAHCAHCGGTTHQQPLRVQLRNNLHALLLLRRVGLLLRCACVCVLG
jgi:hypothetical protein